MSTRPTAAVMIKIANLERTGFRRSERQEIAKYDPSLTISSNCSEGPKSLFMSNENSADVPSTVYHVVDI